MQTFECDGKQHHLIRILPDGNCMFRAFARGHYGSQTHHSQIRKNAIHHIETHSETYETKIVQDWKDDGICSLQDYCMWMRENGSWGDEHMLRAISATYDCTVTVFIIWPNGDTEKKDYKPTTKTTSNKTVHLAYSCASEHYSAVAPSTTQPTKVPAMKKRKPMRDTSALRRSVRLQKQRNNHLPTDEEYCKNL